MNIVLISSGHGFGYFSQYEPIADAHAREKIVCAKSIVRQNTLVEISVIEQGSRRYILQGGKLLWVAL